MKKSTSIILVLIINFLVICLACTIAVAADKEKEELYTSYEQTNFYYDFNDILIPSEIEPQDDEKYVFDDEKFKAGFRIFEGRVVADDLFNFFVNNMTKDNWVKKYSINSEKSVLVFEKPNKTCMIQIDDSGWDTKVTVFAIELKN